MKRIPKLCFLFLFSYSFLYGDANTDLLESASSGNLDGVKKSLSEKANINYKDSLGTSALMFAANNDYFPIVKFLVDNKADVLAKNTNGWTAAIMAAARGNRIIKEYLESEEQAVKKSGATAIVLTVVGDVSSENKKLHVGDMVLENQTIYVGKKSNCEIQVKQSQSEFIIRLREETLATLKFKETPEENIFSGFVKQGSALFKVEKVFTGEKIQAITPTVTAGVRGTAFEVNVAPDGGTKIEVHEGVVQTRIRAPGIEEDEVIENTPEIQKLVSNLEHNSQNVGAGNSIEVTPKRQADILEKADAEGLRRRAMRTEYSTAPIPTLNLRCSEKPSVKKAEPTSEADATAKKVEMDNLVGVEGAKLRNTWETPEILTLIDNRKEEKAISNLQPEVLKLPDFPKQPEAALLKNGTLIKGSIYQMGKKYVIFTNSGKQVVNEEDVDRFIFQ
ncbi:MAG: ankyrin repeat domain-containing protein [Leptospiraceae bacterium]|nr:ankyrin repeat domain-containing protein [Leptospiraceae bacterium]